MSVAALPSAQPVQAEAKVTVGTSVSSLQSDGTSLWAVSDAGVVRIDPTTTKVVATFPLPSTPDGYGLAVGGGSLWVADFDENAVYRLDPKTGKRLATIAAGPNPGPILYADGSVWVGLHRGGAVSGIDPATNKIVSTITVGSYGPGGPTNLASGDGSIWVSTSNDGTIVRIDPATNKVSTTINATTEVNNAVVVDPTGVWAVLGGDLARIDPVTNAITSSLTFDGRLGDPLVKDGVVWLGLGVSSSDKTGYMVAVDPATNAVVETLAVPDGTPDHMVSAFGSIWLELYLQGIVERLAPSALTVRQ